MDSHRVWGLVCCVFLLSGLLGFADQTITISSPAFAAGKPMPSKYADKADNLSPELRIGNVPENAHSLVLIVDDPDAPSGLWTHWLVWNLPASTAALSEGELPPDAVEGRNSFGNVRYDGPAPPSGTHRYFFHLYALNTKLSLPAGSDRDALEKSMIGHIVGVAEYFGTYSASK
jgi:Raf kinase inhibitor-like YbhB/YbcL family protein